MKKERRSIPAVSGPQADGRGDPSGGFKSQEIRDEIENLPANQRSAVILHKYQELDYSQIACILRARNQR